MAIAIQIPSSGYDTYDDLVAAVSDYLDGQVDTTQLGGWVGLVEAEINRRLALRPVRPQLIRDTIALDAEYVDLPDDLMKVHSLDFENSYDDRKSLRFVDHIGLVDDVANPVPREWLFSTTVDYTGEPEVGAVIDGEMRVYPVPDATYAGSLLYYARLPALSSANQSNWFLSHHSDVYLYGMMFHANTFLPDKETAAQWFDLFDTRLQQVLTAYPSPPVRRQLRTDLSGFV